MSDDNAPLTRDEARRLINNVMLCASELRAGASRLDRVITNMERQTRANEESATAVSAGVQVIRTDVAALATTCTREIGELRTLIEKLGVRVEGVEEDARRAADNTGTQALIAPEPPPRSELGDIVRVVAALPTPKLILILLTMLALLAGGVSHLWH